MKKMILTAVMLLISANAYGIFGIGSGWNQKKVLNAISNSKVDEDALMQTGQYLNNNPSLQNIGNKLIEAAKLLDTRRGTQFKGYGSRSKSNENAAADILANLFKQPDIETAINYEGKYYSIKDMLINILEGKNPKTTR